MRQQLIHLFLDETVKLCNTATIKTNVKTACINIRISDGLVKRINSCGIKLRKILGLSPEVAPRLINIVPVL